MWLPPALLLLCLPGCLSLGGSGFVRGTAGSSLTIRCWYEESYKGYNKYWCRGEHDIDCDKIVETWGEEREQRNGRVSIQDNSDTRTLTVTMRNLHVADAGPYWCKIQTVWILDVWSRDPSFRVQVSVSPGPTTHPTTPAATPATFLETITGQNVSTNRVPSSCPGVPLSTVYFLLLVLMKVPLLLSILGVVLCVSRRQMGPERRRSQLDHGGPPDHRGLLDHGGPPDHWGPPDHGGLPDHWGPPDHCGPPDHGGLPDHWGLLEHRDPPCHAPALEKPCPGIQLFRLDKRDLWALHSRTKRQ